MERGVPYPLVRDATELACAASAALAPKMVKGFTNAKVLMEAYDAMETFKKFDLGGPTLSYSADARSGLDFSDLCIIGQDGHFLR